MKQEKIREIMKTMEKERAKLYLLVSKYGLESQQVIEQSRLIDALLLELMALEKQTDTQENL
ncbi:MAG: Spo0E family sporulation regulatory protein-aspartic acid phosphatase [Dethiobacter sp.]